MWCGLFCVVRWSELVLGFFIILLYEEAMVGITYAYLMIIKIMTS